MSGIKQTFASKLTDVFTTLGTNKLDALGSLRYEGSKVYKFVQVKNSTNTVASSATVGTLVSYYAAANNGYLSNLVSIDTAVDGDATTPFGAGALVGLNIAGTPGVSYYCWMQIKGYVVLDTAVTSGAAGKGFTMSATNKTGTVGVAGSSYMGTSVTATTTVVLDAPF